MGDAQMTDRARLGPTEALRAVFSGIGRILMAADRSQGQAASPPGQAASRRGQASAPGQAGARRRDRQAGNGPAAASSRWRSLDQTGNVRLLTAEDLDEGRADKGRADKSPADEGRADKGRADQGRADQGRADQGRADEGYSDEGHADVPGAHIVPPTSPGLAGAAADASGLPLPAYDTLSLASIRARLRSLDADQLRVLVAYEFNHAERPEVLGMLERRIQKLETGG